MMLDSTMANVSYPILVLQQHRQVPQVRYYRGKQINTPYIGFVSIFLQNMMFKDAVNPLQFTGLDLMQTEVAQTEISCPR